MTSFLSAPVSLTELHLPTESSSAVLVLPGSGSNRHVSTQQQQPVPGILQEPSQRVPAQRPAGLSVHRWPHAVPLHQGKDEHVKACDDCSLLLLHHSAVIEGKTRCMSGSLFRWKHKYKFNKASTKKTSNCTQSWSLGLTHLPTRHLTFVFISDL